MEHTCFICGDSPAKWRWVDDKREFCRKCRLDLNHSEFCHSPGTSIEQHINYVKNYMLPYRVHNEKNYYIQCGIGRAKYVINYHDGISKYKDGSNFYDLHICSTKKSLKQFTDNLVRMGYIEKG